jgi:arylsulfatase A-like enzyme
MPPRPNIVFILTDDQGGWALGSAGNPEIRTPTLDGLASSGIRFENFFCVSPVCSPARASLLTGRIPSQHGIHDWIRRGNISAEAAAQLGDKNFAGDSAAIPYLAGLTGYTETLAQNGYTCGLSGKWHLGDSLHPQQGFSFWRVMPFGGSAYYGAPWFQDDQITIQEGYLTDVITEHALAFLDQQAGRPGPFYLGVHYTAPHSPWDAAQHPAALRNLYHDCPFDSVPDLPAHPWQMNSAPRGTGEKRRELLTGYYAAISGVDQGAARILAWLDDHHLREQTLVIFSSDNGMNMGHHGIWGKGNGTFPLNMFDTSVKVPVIFSQPGRLPQGAVNADLLSHYDVMPTLLDYLGLPILEPDAMPGRSFAPLLQGLPLGEEAPIVVFDEYGPVRMIRTRDWKYIHRYPYGPNELYDLSADPGEEHNLAADPTRASILSDLKSHLEDWFLRYADPRVDGAREAVYGKGQLDRAGTFAQGRPNHAGDWFHIDAEGRRR